MYNMNEKRYFKYHLTYIILFNNENQVNSGSLSLNLIRIEAGWSSDLHVTSNNAFYDNVIDV